MQRRCLRGDIHQDCRIFPTAGLLYLFGCPQVSSSATEAITNLKRPNLNQVPFHHSGMSESRRILERLVRGLGLQIG